jgi:hypothetical protein
MGINMFNKINGLDHLIEKENISKAISMIKSQFE